MRIYSFQYRTTTKSIIIKFVVDVNAYTLQMKVTLLFSIIQLFLRSRTEDLTRPTCFVVCSLREFLLELNIILSR